ncbi:MULTISPECIES: carbohydrate ABC transporter permease [Streptomyces]|uniref:Carbohydrate ABC transporter permease n=1 Tax=Streptomyces koyangensis TaxID=188770 RepID=A0A385DF71_9ACTN|nr:MULTISPECIES: carbohydrate ABC transporter permease [Streptomyces]WTD02867.1 carbohydrate ABC transporter permease [Streptomyces albidoflavus]AXQ57093.1 carbohydrate ABC transporter permease [Streptomyces koyangensis]PKR41977.1 sugar ABC transporter permease [Streptomyces sp. EAG2]QRF02364.1 carbohydrate ABC transporter permease [Streptomyces koyangensis]RZE94130.1 carbohydrate ABC transporter permease [Streptomyces sp. SCA2-2]
MSIAPSPAREDSVPRTPATPPGKRSGRPRRSRAGRQLHGGRITYAVLGLVTVISLFPLVWTAIAASRNNTRLAETPPPFWFGGNLFKNLEIAWTDANMGSALLNTVVVAGTVSIGTVLFSTLAGFAFAKLRFRFKNALLLLVIGTMMVPPQLSVVPLYMMVAKLSWSDQLQAVILPTLVTAFGVFFMRQYLLQALPTEIIEAARVDGANSLRVLWHVVFPAARPAMAVLGMLTFVQSWNDFFWPIIALTQNGSPTVQVALTGLGRGYIPDQSVIMAGALLGTLPLLIAFVVFGKQIVGGIMQGAVKG